MACLSNFPTYSFSSLCLIFFKIRGLTSLSDECLFIRWHECRKDFNLAVKCRHFGKKRKCFNRNVYFSNAASKKSCGPSRYVKCGFCSDYYIKGFSGSLFFEEN